MRAQHRGEPFAHAYVSPRSARVGGSDARRAFVARGAAHARGSGRTRPGRGAARAVAQAARTSAFLPSARSQRSAKPLRRRLSRGGTLGRPPRARRGGRGRLAGRDDDPSTRHVPRHPAGRHPLPSARAVPRRAALGVSTPDSAPWERVSRLRRRHLFTLDGARSAAPASSPPRSTRAPACSQLRPRRSTGRRSGRGRGARCRPCRRAAELPEHDGLDAPGWYRLAVLPALLRDAVSAAAGGSA